MQTHFATSLATPSFLPINKKDMDNRCWDQVDFVLITGDAYVDHPSFGAAIISRILESHGFKVAILAQPDWQDNEAFRIFGQPRLGFLITSGNIDSMVNHYTVAKKIRRQDFYSPGGKAGLRPDRALMTYSRKVRALYSDSPIIIGGIEGSLRRLAHYDYWDDKIRRSLLLDAQADLLVYGMGEKAVVEIAQALDSGVSVKKIKNIRGTVWKSRNKKDLPLADSQALFLPSYDKILASKKEYGESFLLQYENTDAITGRTLIEPYRDIYVIVNPPQAPLTQPELDRVYALPYERTYHPSYEKAGGVPAIQEVKFSLISSRGCFGGCSFCALTYHQGRALQARSHQSLLAEAKKLVHEADFKGYIHDVGGPTANFRKLSCEKQLTKGVCRHRECLFPEPCPLLETDHEDYRQILAKLKELPQVKKVFIRSGLRYDYLLHDPDHMKFLEVLCKDHVSGQLKVAPEHVSPRVLRMMGKPQAEFFDKFADKYFAMSAKAGKKQFLVPYLMSSHPGSNLDDAIYLAEYLRDKGYNPEQVQDFYPTPGTLSTVMYYMEADPRTGEEVFVAKKPQEKAMQRALIQYKNPANYQLVAQALKEAGREDLIGFDKKSLIRPRDKAKGKKGRGK